MIGRRGAAALGAALLVGACASVPPPLVATGDTIAGRLAVKVDAWNGTSARSVSATFELQGTPQTGQLNLATPLGSVLAQARWSPGAVVLVTPQGERRYPTLDDLTTDVLGESVPVPALFDWLRGRPWSGAPSVAAAPPAGRGFEQLGWRVDLARYDEAWVVATREQPPVVTVRAKLDAQP